MALPEVGHFPGWLSPAQGWMSVTGFRGSWAQISLGYQLLLPCHCPSVAHGAEQGL